MDKRNSDTNLIEATKNNDESALIVLTERYQNVCLSVGWKYKINLKGDVMTIVYEAAKGYDKFKKTKFSTWLHNFTFYKIQNIKCKTNREQEFIDNYTPEVHPKEGYSSEELLSFIQNKRIKQIISLKYLGEKELSYEEVGKILGLSRQIVMLDFKKGLEIIRKKLKSV